MSIPHSLMSQPNNRTSMINANMESPENNRKRLIVNGDMLQSDDPFILECSDTFIKVCLFRHASNIIFLTDTNSQKCCLYGTLYCIYLCFLTALLKWIKVLMLDLFCPKSDMPRVGFHWRSKLLSMSNMRWSQLICSITCIHRCPIP